MEQREELDLAKSAKEEKVPLPGIQDIATEQQTIIEVINKVNQPSLDYDHENQQEHFQSNVQPNVHPNEFSFVDEVNISKTEIDSQKDLNKNSNSDNSVPVSADDIKEFEQKNNNSSSSIEKLDQKKDIENNVDNIHDSDAASNVLHIESHLIETYDDYQNENASVGIVELKPKQIELGQGTSKIESDTNLRTVVEVDPAGAKSRKLIEKQVSITNHPKFNANLDNTEVDEKEHIKDIETHQIETQQVNEDLQQKKEEQIEQQQTVEVDGSTVKKVEVEQTIEVAEEPQIDQVIEEQAVKQKAEKLVDDIEKEIVTTISKYTFTDEKGDENLTEELVVEIERVLNNTLDKQNSAHANDDKNLISEIEREVLEAIDEKLNHKVTKTDKHGTITTEVDQVLKADKTLSVDGVITDSIASESLDQKPENTNVSDCTNPTVASHSLENNKSEKVVNFSPTNIEIKELADDCKREYYKSLRRYLLEKQTEKPQVPLATYLWEDLRRAKERGGYPWTHLYKRPLGPDEFPDFSLFLRKTRGNRFVSESPKSTKRVRIDDQVLVKETECYIQDLSTDEDEEHIDSVEEEEDEDEHSLHSENFSCTSDSIFAIEKSKKSKQLKKLYNILRPTKKGKLKEDTHSLPDYTTEVKNKHFENAFSSPEHKKPRCYPIMKKLKNMADRQKKRLNIKRVNLKKENNIVLGEETKILKLRQSPKADRDSEIPHFIEKQDSDDILEIVELDESPSRKHHDEDVTEVSEKPDELDTTIVSEAKETETTSLNEKNEQQSQKSNEANSLTEEPPKKAPRLRREHVYEEIKDKDIIAAPPTPDIFEKNSLKASLTKQDNIALRDIEPTKNFIPLDRMGSSEEEVVGNIAETKTSHNLLAPISSIDSTSSDEVDLRHKPQLMAVVEESDTCSVENKTVDDGDTTPSILNIQPALKKEPSPTPSDKKVTFLSDVEPHREDIELAPEVQIATAAASKKWKGIGDHEYEAIATPDDETGKTSQIKNDATAVETNFHKEKPIGEIEKNQDDKVKSFHLDIDESQLEDIDLTDLQDGDEPPLKPESNKKGLFASAQDRTRKVHAGLVNQADKIKNKFRFKTQKPLQENSEIKESSKPSRALEFSKIKMPEMKRFKNFKRPKLTAPDLSKFKISEKLHTLKLGRSKSFKENEVPYNEDENAKFPTDGDTTTVGETQQTHKKFFDIGFGTYPRALRKKKTLPAQTSLDTTATTATEDPSISQSIGTPPSAESTSTPQGDRGPGPVRSRWADKFSDVSYNDSEGSRYRRYDSEQESEGSRYRRYGSEQESFERDDSLLDEQRLKEDLDNTSNETPKLGILSVSNKKQFADFDEENRAIHKISDLRAVEFKRRPLQHQDSDLRSEDSKDAEGWTDNEILKNKLLRKAELDAEAGFIKYSSDDFVANETQSTASSGKKVVMEEIDDDEFFLRKRGISEDNIEIRQYISDIIREGYDTPVNSLRQVGRHNEPYEYDHGYDVPPPKPRRLRNRSRSDDERHNFEQHTDPDNFSLSQNGSDFFDAAPKRPQRKRQNLSTYSRDSQERQIADEPRVHENYFDDDEEYLRPPKTEYDRNIEEMSRPAPPQRQKRRMHDSSMERDSYINGFTGRSVSNSYLQKEEEETKEIPTERLHRNIVLATPENYSDGGSMLTNKSKSILQNDDDFGNNIVNNESRDKYIIDMLDNENDGYAVVRKENIPKPTPPARRKKFSRKNLPPERPPPPENYNPTPDLRSNGNVTVLKNIKDYDDEFDGPEFIDEERPESPKNLQSGDIINKMKFRPLPAPPRPPREKRLRGDDNILTNYRQPENAFNSLQERSDMTANSSTADSYETEQRLAEIEVSTQTDPLPDDFYIEELEITDEMKIIEPRVPSSKNFNNLLWEQQQPSTTEESAGELNENEQLLKGLQRFRDANQRSLSEKSRASSQADRSRSMSRPQTPSAIVIERRVSTPISSHLNETMVEASLVVRPIDDSYLDEPNEPKQHEEHYKEIEAEQNKSYEEDVLQSEEEIQTTMDSTAEESTKEEAFSDEETKKFSIDEYLNSKELLSDDETKKFSIDDYLKTKELFSKDESKKFSIDDYLNSKELFSKDESKKSSEDDYQKSKEVHSDDEINKFSIDDYLKSKELLSDDSKEFSQDEYPVDEQLSDEDIKKLLLDEYLGEELSKSNLETFEENVQDTNIKDTKEQLKRESDNYEIETVQLELRQDNNEPKTVEIKELEKPQDFEEKPSTIQLGNLQDLKVDTHDFESNLPPPQPPPRRKSMTATADADIESMAISEANKFVKEITPEKTVDIQHLLEHSTHVRDLEVERLRVHALQAGQIMVSQLHGAQISSDELECKSGNLIIKNIELPPGLIEDIVERVRNKDRTHLLTTETQTTDSTENIIKKSLEQISEAPTKPPRQRNVESLPKSVDSQTNLDEETQTDSNFSMLNPSTLQNIYPSIEYLQSLAPLAFYNIGRIEQESKIDDQNVEQRSTRRHHHKRRSSSIESKNSTEEGQEQTKSSRQLHSRKVVHQSQSPEDPQTITQAGRQLISACNISLIRTINQLTSSVQDQNMDQRVRQIPTVSVLFIIITLVLLIYLLSGKSVHTHHWDFFNAPGSDGRQS